ncbi:MAG: hypothetical protein OHK006_17550 [Thermodesulfovibrionales bacterium]
MRFSLHHLTAGLLCLILVSGCGRQPAAEINDARAAVDSVMADGAEKYAPEEAARLNKALAAALDEVAAQDKKLLRDYGHARVLLAAARTEATALAQRLPEWKAEARAHAAAEFGSARSALSEAMALADRYRKSNRGSSVRDFLSVDIARIQARLADAHKQITAEDYLSAATISAECRQKAETLARQLRQGMPNSSAAK